MEKVVIVLDEQLNQRYCYERAFVQIIDQKTGIKKERIVTVESLVSAIKKSIVNETNPVLLGRMPFGYFDGAVSMKEEKFCADVITVLPASKQIVQYEGTRYDVCMPSLVFEFKIEKEVLAKTSVFCLKDKVPTEKSQLYRYPFGNVHSSGSVCWGSNPIPRIRDLRGLEEVMTLFIQSPCNDDLYNSLECVGVENLSLRQLLEKIKNMDTFPEEFLMLLKKGQKVVTLEDKIIWKKKGGWLNE